MQVTKSLYNVQLGVKEYSRLNLDFLLKKLSFTSEDVFILDREEHEIPPFAAKFCSVHASQHILAVASEDGDVMLLDSNRKANDSLIKQWKAHYNAIFDICWLSNECKLITASGDRTSILWDAVNSEKITVFEGHKSSVKSVCSKPKSPCVFATASRDGSIRIWDIRCNRSYNDISCGAEMTIRDAHNAESILPATPKQRKKKEVYSTSGNPRNSVTSIEFQDENLLFSAGTADGIIKVWDLRKNYSSAKKEAVPCGKFPYKGNSMKGHGFTSLVFNDSNSILYANCTDSVIYAYNASSYSSIPLATYHGHKTSTFFVKMVISKDNKYLLSGSSDNHAYIWKTSKPGHPLLRLKGHQAEVTAVAWSSTDITKIATCSDDVQVILWNINENLTGISEKYADKPLGESEEMNEIYSSQEIVSKNDRYFFSNIEQDKPSAIVCDSSPQTPKFSSSSCTSSPDIRRWFKPCMISESNTTHANDISFNPSTKSSNSCKKRSATQARKRQLLRSTDKTPKRAFFDTVLSEERENRNLTTPKVATSPDESRVLSPKKPINETNVKNLQNVRRSLDMDSATSHGCSSKSVLHESNKDLNRKKDNNFLANSTMMLNIGMGDNKKQCKTKTKSHHRSDNRNCRISHVTVPACTGQFAPITNYFLSMEDSESSAGN